MKLLGLGLVLAAFGCAKASSSLPTVTVDDLDRCLASSRCAAVDANNQSTRQRMGKVRGAILLSSYDAYALSELPAEKSKPLVFYCANEHCGASHEAAEKAKQAGYTDVAVMSAGIAGWKKAGKAMEGI